VGAQVRFLNGVDFFSQLLPRGGSDFMGPPSEIFSYY